MSAAAGGGLVRVINPNSNTAVTAGMSEAVECLRDAAGPTIDCITLERGPFGVETLADVNLAERLLLDHVAADTEADAFVIGCYSDPGLFACRDATPRPVFGIQECAALLAIARGGQFGVISLSTASVARHLRHLRMLGLAEHCAGDRPADLTVAESEGGGRYLRAPFERRAKPARRGRRAVGDPRLHRHGPAPRRVAGIARCARHRADAGGHVGGARRGANRLVAGR